MVALVVAVARAQVRADRADRFERFELENAGPGPAFLFLAFLFLASAIEPRQLIRIVAQCELLDHRPPRLVIAAILTDAFF